MNCEHKGEVLKYADGSQRCLDCEKMIKPDYKTQIKALAATIAQLREALERMLIVVGNHTGEEIKCDTITEKKWIAAALKGGE